MEHPLLLTQFMVPIVQSMRKGNGASFSQRERFTKGSLEYLKCLKYLKLKDKKITTDRLKYYIIHEIHVITTFNV